VFYAISYPFWTLLFDEAWSKATLKTVEGSFGVHMWNKMSSETTVTVGSQQAYGLLAQKHCPRVYSNCGPVF
jgi:lactosylceramide 4-alpha-galactosyltransferase